jgi:aminoglycoside phosphotransferase (APT) family kinase protein
MISSPNADLVQRDQAITGLRIILDPEVFTRLLGPYLAGMRIKNAQITYIRYKPDTRCLVNYNLNTGKTTLNVYAVAHGNDKAVKINNVRSRKTVNRYGIPGRIIFEDEGILIWVFPNDSKLKALRALDDDKKQKRLLKELLPDRPDLWHGAFKMLNYKPERRFVAVLQTKSGPQAVVRFYNSGDYHKALTIANAFHSLPNLSIPRKIGSSDDHKVLVFEWLEGQVLSDVLGGDYEVAMRVIHETGVALAGFHLQEVGQLPGDIKTEKAEKLQALADSMKLILPHLSTRALAAASHLASKFSLDAERKPIHGDFYAKQVLINNNKQTSFIDLDEAMLGDPRADLGLFIAYLKYMVLSGRLAENRLPTFTQSFLNGYYRIMGKEQLGDLHPYVAAGLFQLLPHPFRHCEKDWIMWTEQILNMVESEISKARSNRTASSYNQLFPARCTTVAVVNPYDIGQDQNMSSFLLRALNPQEVEPLLTDMLSNQFSKNVEARLRKINVLRYKPDRRCLVEYEIEVKSGRNNPHNVITLIGKARSKGSDFTTYNLVRDLWNSGFDSNSADFISVPQPIGIIPELHMWFQKKVPGIPAIDALVRSNYDSLNLTGRIAEAIDKVHRTDNSKNREHTIFDELKILDERLSKVAEEKPLWKTRIERLLGACQRLTRYVPDPKTASIHRDFYHDQLIVDGHRIYIIDFDNYCKGDPALDIGNFKAHLEEYALRKNDDVSSLSDLEEVFVQRFLELSGKSKRFSVEAYTAFTLARHIWISTQFPSRRHLTQALISLCERRLHSLLNQV